MADINDNKRKLFDSLNRYYDMGDFDTFSQDVEDDEKRKKLYDAMQSRYDLPSFAVFTNQLVGRSAAGRTAEERQEWARQYAERAKEEELAQAPAQAQAPEVDEAPAAPQRNIGVLGHSVMGAQTFNETPEEEQERMSAKEERRQHYADTQEVRNAQMEQLDRLDEQAAQTMEEKSHLFGKDTFAGKVERGIETVIGARNPGYEYFKDLILGWTNPEYGAAKATREKIRETRDMMADVASQMEDSGLENSFLANAAKGFWDGATKISTWDFGATDITNTATMMRIANKFENGEELTPAEDALLTAMASTAFLEQEYSPDKSVGYEVGESLPMSFGFMAQLMANPASGMGKAAQAWAIKKFGRTGFSKLMQKTAQYAARGLGDIAEATAASVTTGAGVTANNVMQEMLGDTQYELGDNNTMRFTGQADQKGVLPAIGLGLKESAVENWTEMAGAYFAPLENFMRNGTSRLFRLAASKEGKGAMNAIADWLQTAPTRQFDKLLGRYRYKTLEEAMHFNGVVGEGLEEELGMFMDAILPGGEANLKWFNPFDEAPRPGDENYNEYQNSMFNWRNQMVTWLSVAAMTPMLSGAGKVQRHFREKPVRQAADNLYEAYGEEEGKVEAGKSDAEYIMQELAGLKPTEAADKVIDLVNRRMISNNDQLRAALEYSGAVFGYQTGETNRMYNSEANPDPVERMSWAAFDAGASTTNDKAYGTSRSTRDALNDAREAYGDGFVKELTNFGVNDDVAFREYLDGISDPKKRMAAERYWLNMNRAWGYQWALNDREEREADGRVKELNAHAREDGTGQRYVTTATTQDGRQVYIDGRTGNTVTIQDENGNPIMVPASSVTNEQNTTIEDATDAARAEVSEKYSAIRSASQHHPKTQAPAVGLVLHDGDTHLMVVNTFDGHIYVQKATLDAETQQWKPTGGDTMEISEDAVYGIQDVYYEAEDAEPNAVQAEEERASVAEVDEQIAPAKTGSEALREQLMRTRGGEDAIAVVESALETSTDGASVMRAIHDGTSQDAEELATRYAQARLAEINAAGAQQTEAEAQQAAEEVAAVQTPVQAQNMPAEFGEVQQRWQGANKIVGGVHFYTMPKSGGEKKATRLKGHYVLVEQGAATASHDPHTFEPAPGLTDENGQTWNSRDYRGNSENQRIVNEIGANYGSAALDNAPIVSSDGVVWSGNNRVMSGQLAAENGTDKDYIEALAESAEAFGFTEEQVRGMQHPRVYFVPDVESAQAAGLGYDRLSFGRFNAADQKVSSAIEVGAELGKSIKPGTFHRLTDIISGYETGLKGLLANKKSKGAKQAIDALIDAEEVSMAGSINKSQFYDENDGLTEDGEMLINAAFMGYIFSGDTETLERMTNLKKKQVATIAEAMPEITKNRTLGEGSLDDIIREAIRVVTEANKGRGTLDDYLNTMEFNFDGGAGRWNADVYGPVVSSIARAINGQGASLKGILASYNGSYGQDMFGNSSRDGIIRDILRNQGYDVAASAPAQEAAPAAPTQETPAAEQPAAEEAQGEAGQPEYIRMTDDEFYPHVEAFLNEDNTRGTYDIQRHFKVGYEKATRMFERYYGNRVMTEAAVEAENLKQEIIQEVIRIYKEDMGAPLKQESIDTMQKTPLAGLYTTTAAAPLLKQGLLDDVIRNFRNRNTDETAQQPESTEASQTVPRVPSEASNEEQQVPNLDAPINTLGEAQAFMRSIGYNGAMSKVMTNDEGKKFVKYNANGSVTPNIYFGETTGRDVLQQFYLYDNIMGVNIPADVEAEFERDAAKAKEIRNELYASDRETIKNILTEAGIPFHDVVDSERGSRIVFTDEKNENGNYTQRMDVSDPEQAREDIEQIKARAKEAQKPAEESEAYGANNKLVTTERYEELKKKMLAKLRGQLNVGFDPELLAMGAEMAAYHIEAGARTFADFVQRMVADMGDIIRPYLKAFYNGARDMPGMEEMSKEMTTYDEVSRTNVTSIRQNEPASEENAEESSEETGNNVNLQQEASEEVVRKAEDEDKYRAFSNVVATDMLEAMQRGERPYKSIRDIRARAKEVGLEVDEDGRTDILLQELVEDGLVAAARHYANTFSAMRAIAGEDPAEARRSRDLFDKIVELYSLQPTIARRSANRVRMQQYSTPLPMSFVADAFAYQRGVKDVLEPTAGNGMMVFAVPETTVHANELDKTRLSNLRAQRFKRVTDQDATQPFEGDEQYDAIVSNPPFGKAEAKEYDGKMIPGLAEQIALNALSKMKDNGRAAIIIGGNMEYSDNGAIKSQRAFFTYLYDHYNVKGVIDMDGKLYQRQGTTYPTRMILIDGRRSEEERAQTKVFPPTKDNAPRKANSFEELYEIAEEIRTNNNKTNGTTILRSSTGTLLSNDSNASGNPVRAGHSEQHSQNDTDGGRRPDTGRSDTRTGERQGTAENRPSGVGRDGVSQPGNAGLAPTQTDKPQSGRTSQTDNEGRGDGGNGGVRHGDVQRERPVVSGVGIERPEEKRKLDSDKLSYRRHNTGRSLESVAPAAMVEAMDENLKRIEDEVGNIDEWIASELGYDTTDALHDALAAEQIDSVAMAIYQMKHGQAMIIGDQTGVGKGRQMAALIRWARRQGKRPIFITKSDDLFSDIYRDLADIGSGELRPFIFNASVESENKETGEKSYTGGVMTDNDGKLVYRSPGKNVQDKIFASGVLPDEYDFAVLTYSQVNTGDKISREEAKESAKSSGERYQESKKKNGERPTPKATFLRAIAKDNYMFLDESHNAAGKSNTGFYFQSIIKSAKGVTFASATFAKRPDTMPMYALRTAMSKAKVKTNELIGIIERGGVTLQEIMSRALTQAGQMVRRERDMSDVVTDWKTVDDPETVRAARDNYDKTIQAFNAIIDFQRNYVAPHLSALSQSLSSMASSAGTRQGTEDLGIRNVAFASKTYNYTKQLMLALKVDAIVDETVREIEAGRHPVIALENTMGSLLSEYAPGDTITDTTFAASLIKGLRGVLRYTVKDEDNNEQQLELTPEQLGPEGESAYYAVEELIRESTKGVFVSPLDAIIEKLQAKGYRVGELTGRNTVAVLDEASGEYKVRARKDKDKKKLARDFNSGAMDVLILNKSAATGISLHASEKFSDQRQRTMIIAQPLADINDYMQMIGRIDRTGQVHRGYYINLGLPVPAENRFLMMLATKLKSLNANTTTSQENEGGDVEAPDLLNKYGSRVVVEYLRDNPDIYVKMGEPLKKDKSQVKASALDEYEPQEDDARKITGYVALLTTAEQDAFYDDVVRRYKDLIKYLDDTGSNDLKIAVMPLRAKTVGKKVSSEGVDPTGNNLFAGHAYVEKVEMDVLKKPMKAAEVRKTIEQLNPTENRIQKILDTVERETQQKLDKENARYEAAMAKVEEDIAKKTESINKQEKASEEDKREAIERYAESKRSAAEESHSNMVAKITQNGNILESWIREFSVGQSVLVPDDLSSNMFSGSVNGIFCGIKSKDNGITRSTTFAVFCTLDGRRKVEIKLSDGFSLGLIQRNTNDNWYEARRVSLENWDEQIPSETRTTGYIMTGNILQAYADITKEGHIPGQLVSFTDIDGNVRDGILMAAKWNPSELRGSSVPISAKLEDIKNLGYNDSMTSADGRIVIGKRWGDFYLQVPKAKKTGGEFFEDDRILDLVGGDFRQQRGQFRADVPDDNIDALVARLSELGVQIKVDSDVSFDDETQDEQRVSGEAQAPSEEAVALRDALQDVMSDFGNQLVTDSKEVQAMASVIKPGTKEMRVPGFYSNAWNAVEGVKQDKATPEQWLSMLTKAGGIKAGEDKWIGLSEWLKGQTKKSLTKQEVLDYIAQNQIQLEEFHYGEVSEINEDILRQYVDEFRDLKSESEADTEFDRANDALAQMIERHGREFDDAFDIENTGEEWSLVPNRDWDGNYTDEAKAFLGAPEAINSTRARYTTTGLENNREVALTVPSVEPYHGSMPEVHFDDHLTEGKTIAWARFGETTGDGSRVLVIDEIQSQRHQDARENGYRPRASAVTVSAFRENGEGEQIADILGENGEVRGVIRHIDGDAYYAGNTTFATTFRHGEGAEWVGPFRFKSEALLNFFKVFAGVPDAPFEKNWHELAMKRMLRLAAEEGYDKLAWTTGGQQAERYDIGEVIEYINRGSTNKEGVTSVGVKTKKAPIALDVDKDGNIVYTAYSDFEGKTLSDVIGKELAKKVLSADENTRISGDGLHIGGEGMKGFYDEMLPRFMDKYGKKWGVKTHDIELPNVEEAGRKMHAIDITPEMRRSVLQGQPMFMRTSTGHDVYGFTYKGKIYVDPRIATAETPVHEYTHLWAEALRKKNPAAWGRLAEQMLDGDLYDYVKRLYPELSGNDLVEEVFAHFSGRRGEARLRAEQARMEKEARKDKAAIRRMFEKLRKLLSDFWTQARDLFAGKVEGIENISAEDFADMVLNDILGGFNPVAEMGGYAEESQVRAHKVTDPYLITKLESEPTELGYRNVVQNEDGTFSSPMATKLGKKGEKSKPTSPIEQNRWEQADENPGLADENGKITLVKSTKGRVEGVDYNPYIHIRPDKVNKQFKEAWNRPDLVYVETAYPASELTSGYHAEKAKLPVGRHSWNGGELILSRYDKPTRVVPWKEVADDWESAFKDRGAEFDIVPPALLPILAERGVEILPPHKGMGKACNDAYKAWKEQNPDDPNGGGTRFRSVDNRASNEAVGTGEIRATAERTAKALGENVSVVDNIEELPRDVRDVVEAEKGTANSNRVPGVYHNGSVYIITSECTDAEDAAKTILHEVVGHDGLRKIVGAERYDDAMLGLMEMLPARLRNDVQQMARKRSYDMVTAMDEWLAEKAENGAPEPNLWEKVRAWFNSLLRGIGIDIDLSEAEVKYLIWRSRRGVPKKSNTYDFVTETMLRRAAQTGAAANANARANAEDVIASLREKYSPEIELIPDAKDLTDEYCRDNFGVSKDDFLKQTKKTLAFYNPESKKTYIFARYGYVGERIEEGYFHENLHRFINEELSRLDRSNLIGKYLKHAKNVAPGMVEWVSSKYDSGEVAEELFVYNFSDAMLTGDIDTIEADLKEAGVKADYVSLILNWFGYDRTGETGVRKENNRQGGVIRSARSGNEERVGSLAEAQDGNKQEVVRFRSKKKGASTGTNPGTPLQQEYDKKMRSSRFRAKEGLVDYLASVEEFQKLYEKHTGNKVLDSENAYWKFNALSSKTKEEFDMIEGALMRPLADAVHAFTGKKGIKYEDFRTKGTPAYELSRYVKAKHGIERNRDMSVRAALKGEEDGDARLEQYYADIAALKETQAYKDMTWAEQQRALDRIADGYGFDFNADYSGLTSDFADDGGYIRAHIIDAVEVYENEHGADKVRDLWEAIKSVTEYSLGRQAETGLISADEVSRQKRRYDYFVPLREFEEDTTKDIYDDVRRDVRAVGNPVRRAEGRMSSADTPFASMINVAYRTALAGNKNEAAQALLSLCTKLHDDLVTVSPVWYDILPDGTKVAAYPDIPDDATADEVAEIYDAFEREYEAKQEAVLAKREGGKRAHFPVRLYNAKDLKEHQINVWVGGVRRVITIAGDKRLAMAVSGELNSGNKIAVINALNSFMSGAFTSYNPSFALANLSRDTLHANARAFITESPAYWARFTAKQKFMLGNAASLVSVGTMLYRYQQSRQDKTVRPQNEKEKRFWEFMENGGATGYTFIHGQEKSVEDLRQTIIDMHKGAKQWAKLPVKKLMALFQFCGETAELVNRFAAYETSREMGRSVTRSINDAKEITLNFNKRGAGLNSVLRKERDGRTSGIANIVSRAGALGRMFYVFFNARVQGAYQMYDMAKKHPGKFTFTYGALPMTASALILPAINALLPAVYAAMGLGGDDDDEVIDYYDALSEYTRAHNICIRLPKDWGWFKVPVTPEMATFFQWGDTIGQWLSGRKQFAADEASLMIAKGAFDMVSPVSVNFENPQNFALSLVPSFAQPVSGLVMNRDFMGRKWYKDNYGSQYNPRWMNAVRNESPTLIAIAKALNEVTQKEGETTRDPGLINMAPSLMRALGTGYLGGMFSTPLAVADAFVAGAKGEEGRWLNASDLPVVGRFWQSGNKEVTTRATYNQYYREVGDFVKRMEHIESGLMKDAEEDPSKYDEWEKFASSDRYKKYSELVDYDKSIQEARKYYGEDNLPDDVLKDIQEARDIMSGKADKEKKEE